MFPLHCYPHIVPLTTPRVVPLSPALIRSSQSTHTFILPANLTRMLREARDDWTGCTFRVALCANVLDEFVRALLPRSASGRAGRPVCSTPLRVRTAFFEAVMFLLHCYPHIVLLLPRVSFPLLPLSS